jgi:hypothetical protein
MVVPTLIMRRETTMASFLVVIFRFYFLVARRLDLDWRRTAGTRSQRETSAQHRFSRHASVDGSG